MIEKFQDFFVELTALALGLPEALLQSAAATAAHPASAAAVHLAQAAVVPGPISPERAHVRRRRRRFAEAALELLLLLLD